MEIQVKYFDKDIEKICPIDKGDWVDLRAAETVEMKAGEPTTWNCPECGTQNITSKFCPECGHRKGE